MRTEPAPDVKGIAESIIARLGLSHIDPARLVFFRSYGSTSRASARIWALPKIWQSALNVQPHYVIEVLSQRYDRMPDDEKEKVVIHELLHVPKTFSGGLVPHRCFGKRIDRRRVDELHARYAASKTATL